MRSIAHACLPLARALILAPILASPLALAACSDSSGPSDGGGEIPQGAFTLRSFAGRPLPHLLHEQLVTVTDGRSGTARHYVDGAELTFEDGGAALRMDTRTVIDLSAGPDPAPHPLNSVEGLIVTRDSLRNAWGCATYAVRGDTIRTAYRFEAGAVAWPLLFVRQGR